MLSTVYIKAWFRENCIKETEREEFEKSLLNEIQFETNEAGRPIRKTNENSSGIILKKECIFCNRNLYKNKN